MHMARRLTPEEQYLASQFAAQAGAAQHAMSMPPGYAMSPPAPGAAPVAPPPMGQHHHMARAAQMMAAAAAASPRPGQHPAVAARMAAANHAANLEIGKAFAAAGRTDMLPFLAPRPNTATSGPPAAAHVAHRDGAHRDGGYTGAGQQQQHQLQNQRQNQQQHQQQNQQQNQQQQQQIEHQQQQQIEHQQQQQIAAHTQEVSHHVNHPIPIAAAPPVAPVPPQDAQAELPGQTKLLDIPPIGAPLPSMANMQLLDISTPFIHANDVLCGRGGGTNNHPGNERFRDLVTAQKVLYLHSSKRDKPFVSRGIVRAVRNQNPPGRFLQKDEKNGLWYDIGDQKAREKTSQALREGAPEIRREITITLGAPPRPTLIPPLAFTFGGLPGQAKYPHSEMAAAGNGHQAPQGAVPAAPSQSAVPVSAPQAPQAVGGYPIHAAQAPTHPGAHLAAHQAPNTLAHYEHMRAAQVMAWAAQQQGRQGHLGHLAQHIAPRAAPPNPAMLRSVGEQPHLQAVQRAPAAANFRPLPPQSVVPRAQMMGLGRAGSGPTGVLGGGRLAPMPFGGRGSPLSAAGLGQQATLAPRPASVPNARKRANAVLVRADGSLVSANSSSRTNKNGGTISPRDGQRRSTGHKGRRSKDAPSGPPLPHDCARRLVLAETVAQKTVNGTITDELRAEEFRISLYLDAGLLDIDPADIARSLARGQTESDLVEESYEKLVKKAKRDELLPSCRKAPNTTGALAALGALTKIGIHDALLAIGAAPTPEIN